MKKIIVFDLDGTLARTKSPIEPRMADLLGRLLNHFQVCVISGGKFEQFEKQLLSNLEIDPQKLQLLHIMPTCGTQYYKYDSSKNKWLKVYSEDFTDDEKQKIITALQQGVKELRFDREKTYGDQIEDRGSQITFSALGQEASPEKKEDWDPEGDKKLKLRNYVSELIPEFEVRTGGTTSIDVTKLGIDKAYGMQKLIEILGVIKEEMLFYGDRLTVGGNDYPVRSMGIECIEVSDWEDTADAVESLLAVVE